MCILVDFHVQIQRFSPEYVNASKTVRHDQSPCEIRLRIKIAVGPEQDVFSVKNSVESICFYFVTKQDFSAWSDFELTPVSRESLGTCAVVSSLVGMTHVTTCAAILTGGRVAAVALTIWIRAGLLINSLTNKNTMPLNISGEYHNSKNRKFHFSFIASKRPIWWSIFRNTL